MHVALRLTVGLLAALAWLGEPVALSIEPGRQTRTAAPVPPADEPVVRAATERGVVQTGEHILVVLRAESGARPVAQPVIGRRLGPFEVLSIDSLPARVEDGRWVAEWHVVLIAFEPGDLTIPEVVFESTGIGSNESIRARTSPVALRVTAPDVTADDPLRPLTKPLEAPVQSGWQRTAALAAGLVLGLAAVLVLASRSARIAFSRWKRRWRLRWLEHEARRLIATGCGDLQEARSKYTRVSTVFRQVIAELVDDLSPTDPLSRLPARLDGTSAAGLRRQLEKVLHAVDRARFNGRAMPATWHEEFRIVALDVFRGLVRAASRGRFVA